MAKKKGLTERGLEIQRLAWAGQVPELVVCLQSGFHHGKSGAHAADKVLAAEAILERYGQEEAALTALIESLARHASPMARQVACALLQDLWLRNEGITPLVLELTTDEDWEVREWAAGMYTSLLISDFEKGVQRIRPLLDHPHESVPRQIALAIKGAAQKRIPGTIDTLLDLIEPLMLHESEYVRKNLGPFAIGDGLLRVYPEETLAKMRQWVWHEEWPMRWNVIMSFSAAQGKKHVDAAYEFLTILSEDSRKEVVRAVKKVQIHLGKNFPDDERFHSDTNRVQLTE